MHIQTTPVWMTLMQRQRRTRNRHDRLRQRLLAPDGPCWKGQPTPAKRAW